MFSFNYALKSVYWLVRYGFKHCLINNELTKIGEKGLDRQLLNVEDYKTTHWNSCNIRKN